MQITLEIFTAYTADLEFNQRDGIRANVHRKIKRVGYLEAIQFQMLTVTSFDRPAMISLS